MVESNLSTGLAQIIVGRSLRDGIHTWHRRMLLADLSVIILFKLRLADDLDAGELRSPVCRLRNITCYLTVRFDGVPARDGPDRCDREFVDVEISTSRSTEHYIDCRQRLRNAVIDSVALEPGAV
jgi:hypothetical protein